MQTMKAVVFHGINDIRVEQVPKPRPKPGEAVIRITATTICGTDVHIVKGEYPVRPGLILGHEPVGIIEELGEGLGSEYAVGQRVIVGAITPCGQCFYCLNGAHSQCHGPLGGWRFGNTINGAWAEYPWSRTRSRTSRCCCCRISRQPAFPERRTAMSEPETAWRCLLKGRLDSVPPSAPGCVARPSLLGSIPCLSGDRWRGD